MSFQQQLGSLQQVNMEMLENLLIHGITSVKGWTPLSFSGSKSLPNHLWL